MQSRVAKTLFTGRYRLPYKLLAGRFTESDNAPARKTEYGHARPVHPAVLAIMVNSTLHGR